MKIYLVGGAIRDILLGQTPRDHDWVVVGATSEEMLKQGYKKVRSNFPVFYHPTTREEYALARTEIKDGTGYRGFKCVASTDISIEKDLARRDLTINAIAQGEQKEFIDPFHGIEDLKNKKLRHITENFIDDPIRLLRIARFLARYYHLGFTIADETFLLLKKMVNNPDFALISPQLIWKEMEKALHEKNPEKFFEVLAECGALDKLIPILQFNEFENNLLQYTSKLTSDVGIRFGVLTYGLLSLNHSKEEIMEQICQKLSLPRTYRELILLLKEHAEHLINNHDITPVTILKLFTDFNLLNTPTFLDSAGIQVFIRFKQFLSACQIIAEYQQIQMDPSWIFNCLKKVKGENSKDLITQGLHGKELQQRLYQNRLAAIKIFLENDKHKKTSDKSIPLEYSYHHSY